MIVSPGAMRLARSVTTCSVAAPAGTITHATRGGRSVRTKSSSVVVPFAPSPASSFTPAGSAAYPTISWPPRIRRRAILPPIRPSPTIPSCIPSSCPRSRDSDVLGADLYRRASAPFIGADRYRRASAGGAPAPRRPAARTSAPSPDELADRGAVGDDDHVGGAQEEPGIDDAGDRVNLFLELLGVVDRPRVAVENHVEVVGHERPLVLHAQGRLQLELLQTASAERDRERHDLDRQRAARSQRLDHLVGRHEN